MRKFFEGISVSQIVAGTLAAVTSFLLSAKIGIAGSVIGVAASYIVSTVATRIYQNVIEASGEKLQSVNPSDNGQHAANAEDSDAAASQHPRIVSSHGAIDGERIHNVSEMRPRKATRMAIAVTVISGLIAVALTAGIVLWTTRGHGTDTVVSDWIGNSNTTDKPVDEPKPAPSQPLTGNTTTVPKTDSSTRNDSTDDEANNRSQSSADSSSNSSNSSDSSNSSNQDTSGTASGSDTGGTTGDATNNTDHSNSNESTGGTTGSSGTGKQ